MNVDFDSNKGENTNNNIRMFVAGVVFTFTNNPFKAATRGRQHQGILLPPL